MKPKKLAQGDAYLVYWIDAAYHEEGGKICEPCLTLGFLTASDGTGVRLARERSPDLSGGEEDYRFFFDIPWGCVMKITKLKTFGSTSRKLPDSSRSPGRKGARKHTTRQ